jgi:DNA-binding MarR family transcriptional regulator
MTDINLKSQTLPRSAEAPSPRSSEPVWDIIELLFYAYRDFVGDADEVLKEFGFGRAHHRVLHFVHRYPGLKVADLLDVLRITKQSLGRVLKQLIDENYIVQRAGESDKRQRLLFATPKGEALVAELAGLQTDRIMAALKGMDPGSADTVRRFLRAMIDHDDPDKVLQIVLGSGRSGQRETR